METKQRKKVNLSCDWCGIGYEKYYSAIKSYEHHFCSKSCRGKWVGDKLRNDLEYRESQRQLIKTKGNIPPLHIGENHWNWKGGISKHSRGQDYQYVQWRKDILKKYDYTCQKCGVRGGRLSPHHIVPWSECEALRYDINNGICYCYDCHMELHGLTKK